MTAYEKMIAIIHGRRTDILHDFLANDFFLITNMEMKNKEDFIKLLEDELYPLMDKFNPFSEEKCFFENKHLMAYEHVWTEENGDKCHVTGTIFFNEEGKAWRNLEMKKKLEKK